MTPAFQVHLEKTFADLDSAGLYKHERSLLTAQGAHVGVASASAPQQISEKIRTQVSAAHSRDDLEFAIRAFADVKRELAL